MAGLAFNLMGCANLLSQMNADRVASMPEAYRAMVESRPAWATGAFAVAVFGGALGGVLLLLRKPVAFHAFIASLVGAVAAQVPFFGMAGFPAEAMLGWVSQLIVGAAWSSRRVPGLVAGRFWSGMRSGPSGGAGSADHSTRGQCLLDTMPLVGRMHDAEREQGLP